MSSLKIFFFISIVSLIFSSCTGDSAPVNQPSVTTKAKAPAPTPTPTGAPQPAGKLVPNTLPSVTNELMQTLFETCTNLDYVFYNHSFSMNQTEKAGIQNALSYISTAVPAAFDSGCAPIGRMFFVANGEGLAEVEFYLGSVCNYFIFYKDGKKVAANMMNPKGEEFLKGTINRVKNSMPPGMNK